MRIRTFVAALLAALVLVPAAARAQQMPDPRQMSGQPRQDTTVQLGTTTVRLIHGDLAKNVPGAPVHMIALRGDGSFERLTRITDKDGRATFDQLAQDGSVTYYAFALLGEDRLESQLVTLDKMAGIRLMLVGRKVDAQGQPVGDVIDEANPNPEQPTQQPAGEVHVLLGGRGVNAKSQIELVEIPEPGKPEAVLQKAQPTEARQNQWFARFTGVTGGADKVYLVRLRQGGKDYISKPFMMRPGAGAGRSILVIEKLVVTAHIAGEIEDNKLRVQTQYLLQNFQGSPFDTGEEGLVLPLPVGAIGGAVSDESGKIKVEPGKHVLVRGVLPPGPTEVLAGWAMEINDGKVDFEMAAPHGLFQSSVIIEQSAGARMVPPPGSKERVSETDNGRRFFVVSPLQIPENGTVKFSVSGLPQHPRSQQVARLLVGVLVLALLVAGVLVAVFNPFKKRRAGDKDASAKPAGEGAKGSLARRKELTARREQLYDELVALEKKRVAQQIDEDRYESTRQTVVSRLTLVLRELDQLDTRPS